MEANFHQQHFTVSDGEQDNTEGHNGETDNASSASPFLVVASNHQEKAVILYTLSCVTVREREREMDSHRKGVTKYDSVWMKLLYSNTMCFNTGMSLWTLLCICRNWLLLYELALITCMYCMCAWHILNHKRSIVIHKRKWNDYNCFVHSGYHKIILTGSKWALSIFFSYVLSSQPTKFLLAHLFKKGMWRSTVLLWIIWLTSTAYYFGTFLLATSLFRFHDHCSELHPVHTHDATGLSLYRYTSFPPFLFDVPLHLPTL